MRFDLAELSGALGDLGTFIPLAAALIIVCGLDGGSVLVFAGLANILVGLLFNQPVPVQPMKAIAAVAIAEGLLPGEIAAAGVTTGALVLALGLTGLVGVAERLVPRPVVRGIQLGVGLNLVGQGIGMVLALKWWALDGRTTALLAALLVLFTARRKRFPSALILFSVGLAVLFLDSGAPFEGHALGWSGPAWVWPNASEWGVGLLRGALPQLPLTLLNSVIAVSALSGDLFPGRRFSTRSMALSVGSMNLVTCLFGAMPACHGAGGLAAQYRFGARTGGSVVALGLAKIAIGVAFGGAMGAVLGGFPGSLLGVLLVFAGLELSLPARDAVDRDSFLVVAITAGGILAANTAVGFLLGLSTALVLRRGSREGSGARG